MINKTKDVFRSSKSQLLILGVLYLMSISTMFLNFSSSEYYSTTGIDSMRGLWFESSPFVLMYLIAFAQVIYLFYKAVVFENVSSKDNIILLVLDFVKVFAVIISILIVYYSDMNAFTYFLILLLMSSQVIINVIQIRDKDEIIIEDFSSKVRKVILASTAIVFVLWNFLFIEFWEEFLSGKLPVREYEAFFTLMVLLLIPTAVIVVSVVILITHRNAYITRKTINMAFAFAPILFIPLTIIFITVENNVEYFSFVIVLLIYIMPILVANVDIVAKKLFARKPDKMPVEEIY
jgi:hypothetical protein